MTNQKHLSDGGDFAEFLRRIFERPRKTQR
jgi:hypothetical protein